MQTNHNILPGPSGTDNESRLARIEHTLANLMNQFEQAPSLISIATDSIDETIKNSNEAGVDIEDRLKNGMAILTRLSDPRTVAGINTLLDLVEQSPGLAAMTVDAIDEEMSRQHQGQSGLTDKISNALALLEKVSDTEMNGKLEQLINLSRQLPGLVAIGVDSVDELMSKEKPSSLSFIMSGAEALSEAQAQPPAKVGGLFGMLRAIKDPDTQKALGLLMNVLKNLGKKL